MASLMNGQDVGCEPDCRGSAAAVATLPAARVSATAIAVHGSSYRRRLLSLFLADVARRCDDKPTVWRLGLSACVGGASA